MAGDIFETDGYVVTRIILASTWPRQLDHSDREEGGCTQNAEVSGSRKAPAEGSGFLFEAIHSVSLLFFYCIVMNLRVNNSTIFFIQQPQTHSFSYHSRSIYWAWCEKHLCYIPPSAFEEEMEQIQNLSFVETLKHFESQIQGWSHASSKWHPQLFSFTWIFIQKSQMESTKSVT